MYPMIRMCVALSLSCLLSGCFAADRYVMGRLYREEYEVRRSDVRRVDFCSLPEHVGQFVRTTAVYSGVEEYWSLAPLEPCASGFPQGAVSAGFAGYPIPLPWALTQRRRLNRLHNAYWSYDAVLDVEGYFATRERRGYGHLGSFTSEFVITYIRSVRLVRKATPAQ